MLTVLPSLPVVPELADGRPVVEIYVVAEVAVAHDEVVAALTRSGRPIRVFDDRARFLSQLAVLPPGCAVAVGPQDDAATLTAELAQRGCRFPVVAVVAASDVAGAVRAIKAGAADAVPRPVVPETLFLAVEAAIAACWRAAPGAAPTELRARLARLTRRERQVLDLIVLGEASKAIATRLDISTRTVEVHRANIKEKLACRNLPDLVRQAIMAGLPER